MVVCSTRKWQFFFLAAACLAFSFPASVFGNQSLGLKLHSPYHSSKLLLKNKRQGSLNLQGYYPTVNARLHSNIHQEFQLESLDSPVVIKHTVLGEDILPPMIFSLNQFQSYLQQQHMENAWQEYVVKDMTEDDGASSGAGGINLDIPVRIKSKAFQKIFGSGTVGLNVTGDIRIQAGLRREDRSEVRTALTRGASTNFKMQQTQRFAVTGKIGDKVTINVDQDSERAFDFDNNVKLRYEGYDDEILRRLEAGNISLSLPGTRYVTFSGKNSGLFGIKSEMVLGNLNVTTIASQEKGESQKLSLTGGASEGTKTVKDYQYLENVYFFVDSTFREQYRHFDDQGNHVNLASVPAIDEDFLEVYKAAAGYESQYSDRNTPGWALADGKVDSPADTSTIVFGEAEFGHFIRLERNEYFVENTLGWIRMNTPVAKGEILAVAYRTTDGQTYGDVTRPDTANGSIILKLIKSQNALPSNETWDLAWKHVYSLGGRNIEQEGFDLKIFFDPPSGPDQETDESGRKWLEVFGLDEKDQSGTPNNPDGKIDFDENILDLGNGELHFRDLQPFDPIGYFVNGALVNIELTEDKQISAIYDTTDSRIINAESKFYLEITSKNRSTEYNLGFNVIENSEIVRLDGQELTRGVDYTIDYFSGQLNILDERATNPNSKLDVTYERNQLFQLEKKTILGMRAEYDLGRDSYIGSTLLYLNQSTLDRKVRVGRGPMRNMVWDVNARFRLNPNFIGNALDFLPLIRAKGETNMNIEGEIAQVLPTPNTLNNSRTGDNSGVAYIDDFEASKKTVSLGVIRKNWTQASQPADGVHTFVNKINNFIWYNPFYQVALQDIYPEREVNPNVPNQTHVLTFQLFSDPNEPQSDPNRWGGVMRALSPGFFDQSQTKFIEIMVQGDVGRLHIDLGRISEDVIPNNRLDTEDKQVAGIRNGILDPGEDIGIDGVEKPDPPMNFPRSNFVGQSIDEVPYDFWDVNRNGIKDADEPWSYDDWFYSDADPLNYAQRNAANFSSINGTQNNTNDEGGRLPDTEDINGNGILDPTNNYFSYSFSLSPTHPDTSLIVGGNPNNPAARGGPWKLYRIPLTEEAADAIVGVPQITQIEYVRIWFDELDPNREIVQASIAEINLVGSEWQEIGVTGNEFDLSTASIVPNDTTVAVTQINTHENADYAASLSDIGVEGEEDPVTRVRAREQSLVLVARNLPARIAGIAQKSLFQGEDYIHYHRIRMFVHGIDHFNTHIPADTSQPSYLEYFVRFGADNNNFYEYRSTIYQGWNDFNHMDVRIQDFTNINRTDSTNYDPVTDTFVQYLTPDRSKSIRVKGTPSFTNVKILILGLKNVHPQLMPYDGEIWFNELRLSDVEKEKGMAMRVRSDIKIADFANVNGELEKMDADFHNVATRFGTGDNRLSSSLNANINLDKMLPQFLGIAMPLNLTYRNSSSSSKYFPGQDRLVSDDLPEEQLALVRSKSTQTGFNLSFRRQAQSKNFFIKNTIDNMSFSIGRSNRSLENPTTTFSDAESWTGNFDYRLDFGRDNFFSPLGWLPDLPLVNKLKNTKFYFTPQNVAFKVNGTRTVQSSQNRILNSTQEAPITSTESFLVDRSVRTNMKIFESLSLDFSRAHKADMRGKTASDFFNGNFDDINIAQTFSARYNPQIFSWLTNNFSYSTNYVFNNNIQQQLTGRSARNSVTKSADFTFQWKQLVKSIFGEGKRQRRPPPGIQGREKPQGQMKFFQQAETGGGGFNPLRMVGSFFSNFKDISVNYSERTNLSHLGLQEGSPSLAFQFGLSDTTGIGTVSELSTNSIAFSENKTLSLGSGIAFGRAVDVGLRFQHSEQRNESTTITGSSSDSHLQFRDFDLPFPEWTLRISGLETFPLFNMLFETVSFSHGFSGQKDVTWSGTPENATQENITTNFRPLGKLDLNFKNGFTGSLQLNHSVTLSRSLAFGVGARRTTNQDISVTANYSKRSGFKLPFWPFNKAELKNSIDFSFSFTASNVVTEQSRTQTDGTDQFEEQDKTQRWSFSPRVTYSFSNRVRGGAFIEVGRTNSKRVGETSIQEFGIDINIAIRGN